MVLNKCLFRVQKLRHSQRKAQIWHEMNSYKYYSVTQVRQVSSAAGLIFELSGSSSLKPSQVNFYFSCGISQQHLAPLRPDLYYYWFDRYLTFITVSPHLSASSLREDLQTPAVCRVGSSTRCSCRGIQHFGQHLDQLSPHWNSNTALLQTGPKDFAVGNVTAFLPRCRREAA